MHPERLHILFLCGWYPSKVLPNNGDFIERHAQAVSLRHRVSVLHIITDPDAKKDISIERNVSNNVTSYIAYLKKTPSRIQKGRLFFKAFKQLLTTIGSFDLVHVNKLYPFGLLALYLKFKYKIPFIISEHWTGYHAPLSKALKLPELLLSKHIAKKASYLCPVSKDLENSMRALGLQGRYYPVPNVVDTDRFIPKQSENSKLTLVHISSMLDAHKNVSGILRTLDKLSSYRTDFKLLLVGENSTRYQSLAASLQLTPYIEFHDHVTHERVIEFLQSSDVFVLFSNYENLPCVILESFSCGTPVISTDVGGISEFFPENFGQLIPVNDETALLDFLRHFKPASSQQQRAMHAYAQRLFSYQSIANQFTELYYSSLSHAANLSD